MVLPLITIPLMINLKRLIKISSHKSICLHGLFSNVQTTLLLNFQNFLREDDMINLYKTDRRCYIYASQFKCNMYKYMFTNNIHLPLKTTIFQASLKICDNNYFENLIFIRLPALFLHSGSKFPSCCTSLCSHFPGCK